MKKQQQHQKEQKEENGVDGAKTGKDQERVFEKEGRGPLTRVTASRELEGWKQGVATSLKSQYS